MMIEKLGRVNLFEDLEPRFIVQQHRWHLLRTSLRLQHRHNVIAQIHINNMLADVNNVDLSWW